MTTTTTSSTTMMLKHKIETLLQLADPHRLPTWLGETDKVIWLDGYKTAVQEILKILIELEVDAKERRARQEEQVDKLIREKKSLDLSGECAIMVPTITKGSV